MPDLIATLSYTDEVGKGCAHGEYVGWPDLETAENANHGRKLRDVRVEHVCKVFDGRRAKNENEMERLKFKHTGFELVDDEHLESYFQDIMVRKPLEIDFKDEDQVIRDYVPWVEAMVRSKISEYLEDIFTTTNNDDEPGGQNHPEVGGVWVWDLAYRSSLLKNELQESNTAAASGSSSSEKKEIDKLAPVPLVHADYFDDKGVRKRLRCLLEKRGDTLAPLGLPLRASGTKDLTEEQIIREYCDGDGIVLGVNVWRSTDPDHPVKSNPLALLPIEHWGGNRDDNHAKVREDARGGRGGAHAPPKFQIIITTFTTSERSLRFKIPR